MRAGRLPLRTFTEARSGTAAIEFSLIMPILLLVTLAGGQILQYINATRKVEVVANSVVSMISQAMPPSPSTTTASVNATDLHFSYDSAMVIFPYVLSDAKRKGVAWWNDITISYASIVFTQTSQSCTGQADQSPCYSASVIWTSTGTSTNSYRPCGMSQTAVNNNAAYSRTSLPRSVYGPGSIIAIDVTFTFVPTFGSGLVAPLTITRSAFMQPRYASQIVFNPIGTDGIATTC